MSNEKDIKQNYGFKQKIENNTAYMKYKDMQKNKNINYTKDKELSKQNYGFKQKIENNTAYMKYKDMQKNKNIYNDDLLLKKKSIDQINKNNRDERAIPLAQSGGLYKPLIGAVNKINLLRTETENEHKMGDSMESLGLYKKEGLEANEAGIDAAALAVGQPTVEQIRRARRIQFGIE